MQINGPDADEHARRDRKRVRIRAADGLQREIKIWVSELECYPEHFTASETEKIMELLKISRVLNRSLSK